MTGPDSPNKTIPRFAITGTDLGIMWDNGDPANEQVLMAFGDTKGYCQIPGKQWRYNALLRTQDRSLSSTVSVPSGGSTVIKASAPTPLTVVVNRRPHPRMAEGSDRQQHQPGAGGNRHHPDCRRRRRRTPVHERHVHQDLGRQRRLDHELLGDRDVIRQRRDVGRLPGNNPPAVRR